VKNLGLGGSAAFQWPLSENPNFFYGMHFPTLLLPLAFFHLCLEKLGVVFNSVLCYLDFGV
jgi:hypothetical protein